jgi:signal transduction histidine kinase
MSLVNPPIFPTASVESATPVGSATDLAEAIESSFGWVSSAIGGPLLSIRLSVLDGAGRLRLVSERSDLNDVGRKRSARRRQVVASGEPSVIRLRQPSGASLAILPMAHRGKILGLLEVVASTRAIRRRYAALVAVAGQVAAVLRNVGLVEDAERIARAAADTTSLMVDLLATSSQERAVQIAVRFCWNRLGTPAAGWLRGGARDGFRLVASRGIGREARSALERPDVEAATADAVVGWGGEVLGEAEAVVTRAGDAVLLMTRAPHGAASLLETVEASLSLALDRLALTRAQAELAESVDAGLAWTAHEFRAPLLGVEKVIDLVAAGDHVPEHDRQLLARAQADLRRLTSTVDDLLRWSVGAASIRRRPTDLVRLVSETARSLSPGLGGRLISIEAPQRAVVRVDPLLLRIAVENLIRNSLEHGGDAVEVTVELTPDEATVSVSDRGPGVPPDEVTTLFDPFGRGRRTRRGGRGLGLIIAQRAVQAHDGVLGLEATGSGAVFRMRVPVGSG